MADRAAYDAFLNFREQRFDARSGSNQVAYGTPLGASDVIEFQHYGIKDAAVDTRMLAQVGNYERLVSCTIACHSNASSFIERANVFSVVST